MAASLTPWVLGLTGGIGCGKSTVARLFREKGVETLDADDLAREVSEKGGAAHEKIVALLGQDCVTHEGSLDRAKIRSRVFQNPALRRQLEAIVHPAVFSVAQEKIAQWRGVYGVWVSPLLLESITPFHLVTRVLVVDCDAETQIARVMGSRGLSREAVLAIMRAQLPREERLKRADDVIKNDGARDDLAREVARLDVFYRELAAQ